MNTKKANPLEFKEVGLITVPAGTAYILSEFRLGSAYLGKPYLC